MIAKMTPPLTELYEADETAWLDAMAQLVRNRNLDELDLVHLEDYLVDMAKRDRREIKSRLRILLGHLLKWTHQQEMRTNSWRASISEQRHELQDEFEASKTLRNYALAILDDAYAKAVEWAVDETGLPSSAFPNECRWTLDQLLSPEVLDS